MQDKPKVIIWGVDDYNVLGLFRELGKFNLEIIFLVFQGVKNCASLSKYCSKYIETESLDDGLKYLLEIGANSTNKAVIINSNDLIAEFLDLHRAELSKYYYVPGTATPGLLKKVDSKAVMTEMAERLGFIVPKSRICQYNTNIDGVEFPCLLKPTNQTYGKYNEFKFRVCKDKKSLKNTLRFVRKDSNFILQQYIPKESVALVYGCRTLDGKVYLAGVLEKDRFCDNGDGSHGVLFRNFPAYIPSDLIIKFVESVDFYGLFSVEFLVYKEKAYFIEVNWRNDGTSHLFFQAGANIPLLWVMSCLGESVKDISWQVRDRSYFIDEIFDMDNIRRNVVSKEQWRVEREQATVFKYYDVDDLRPYEVMKKNKKKKLLLDTIVARNRLYIVWLMDKLGLRRK